MNFETTIQTPTLIINKIDMQNNLCEFIVMSSIEKFNSGWLDLSENWNK